MAEKKYNASTSAALIQELQRQINTNTIETEDMREVLAQVRGRLDSLEARAEQADSIIMHLSGTLANLAEVQSKQALIISDYIKASK